MKLSKRLTAIAKLVEYKSLADIGCDHGLLPVFLAKNGKISHAIASDKNPGPLKRAQAAIESAGLTDCIETRLGDGLCPIEPGEADTCVIAGMGGLTIIEILSECPSVAESFSQLILSPERDVSAVRRFLHGNGFSINDEFMVYEKSIFYNIIDVRPGFEAAYSGLGYAFGQKLLDKKDCILKKFIESELSRVENVIGQISETGKACPAEISEYSDFCRQALEILS